MPPDGLLLVGRVGSPHGLDGSFHVSSANASLLKDGSLIDIGGTAYAINRRAGHDNGLILRVAGVADRDTALALRGLEVRVARDLAPPLGDDEWWAEDLEGCRVVDGSVDVGVVTRMSALPSCEVLEVKRASDGSDLLIPLVGDAVRSVDVTAKLIDVDLEYLGEA
jgi:16S rRNA processing protein RimM